MVDRKLAERVAAELALPVESVAQVLALLGEGATAPFLARYRRERTGGLGERQLRAVARCRDELLALDRRRARILRVIERRGALTADLRERIDACADRYELEDLFAPFRKRQGSRAAQARERGLEPLADAFVHPTPDAPASLTEMALPYTNPERDLPDVRTVVEGAQHILAERVAACADTRMRLRRFIKDTGVLRATAVEGKAGEPSKFEMYYDFAEPLHSVPSHRVLAVRRGEKEGWLTAHIEVDREPALAILREAHPLPAGITAEAVEGALALAWDELLGPALCAEIRSRLKRRADQEAIAVFARNLRGLLLQAPAGPRRTLGVEPGYRTGCKLAAVDEQGKLLEAATVFPHEPHNQADEARAAVKALIEKHGLAAVAIGNGQAARETDFLFRQIAREMPDRRLVRMLVSDAGAKLYGTSRGARDEFPDLDPGLRGAVSIARRFQDPLTELVQIEPRAIGVGQYQHEVNQQALREALEAEVESCVNLVGVDPARASAVHLAFVAGFDKATAHELVQHRDQHGPPRSRADLMSFPRIDARCFIQAAGFLRFPGSEQPLDATAIHPERYDLVARIAADAGTDVPTLLGNRERIDAIDFRRYADESCGEPTLKLIRYHLLNPGRDTRRPFRSVEFRDDIRTVEDLKPGMLLEGVVTNVTNFGAFVDVGVHEDGLVHVSELARQFTQDPNDAVQVGRIVRVKVLAVDVERRRISLSMKQAVPPPRQRPPKPGPSDRPPDQRRGRPPKPARPPRPPKPKRDPKAPATREDIERLIAHFNRR